MKWVVFSIVFLGMIGAVVGAGIAAVVSGPDALMRGVTIGAIAGGVFGLPVGLVHRARMIAVDRTGMTFEQVREIQNQQVKEAWRDRR